MLAPLRHSTREGGVQSSEWRSAYAFAAGAAARPIRKARSSPPSLAASPDFINLSPCNRAVRRIQSRPLWRKSKTGQIICYIDRSYPVFATRDDIKR